MFQSIAAQIQVLRKMTVAELRVKHLELFGTETRSRHKDQLFKRLAWRVQELEHGGLSERAKRWAQQIANDLDTRILPPRKPKSGADPVHEVLPMHAPSGNIHPAPGTILTRGYRGEIHQVIVLDQGFEYRGKMYRSLSGIAKEITGSVWSGPLFFNLRKRKTRNGQQSQK